MKKKIALIIVLLAAVTFSYAAGLMSKEAILRFNEAVRAQKDVKYAQAEVFYNKCLMLDPYNAALKKFIINNRGVMSIKSEQPEKAKAAFIRALKIDPDYLPAKYNLGLIYDKEGDELKSIKYWLDVFDIDLDSLKPVDFVLEKEQSVE